MLKWAAGIGLTAPLLISVAACGPTCGGPPAHPVLMNAAVLTIDGTNPAAEGAAFIGEEITAVTSDRAVQAYIGDEPEVIDADLGGVK